MLLIRDYGVILIESQCSVISRKSIKRIKLKSNRIKKNVEIFPGRQL